MPRISFTSNFKQATLILFICASAVIAIETLVHKYVSPRYFSHEVDWLLNQMDTYSYNGRYLLIGDSVALQLYRQFETTPGFSVLATNQAVETTGHYFLSRRYLEKNPSPRAVIFTELPFHFRNLEQVYTENFVYRTFTRLREIYDVFLTKLNPAIAAKMFAYKLLPSYKCRLKLQELLVGFTNSDIYSGVDNQARPTRIGSYSLLKIIEEQLPKETTALVHFEALLDLLEHYGIPLYYIPAPVREQDRQYKYSDYSLHQELMNDHLPAIQENHASFHYFRELVEHDKDWFTDGVHYSPEGLPHGEEYMREKIRIIEAETTPKQ